MTKIVQFREHGGAEVLEVVEIPPQTPGKNEVAIAVKAFGVQRADTMWREGRYIQTPQEFPASLGYDCVGIIDAVGEGVTAFKPGDRVMSLPGFSLNDYTVYGDRAVVNADYVLPLPEVDLSWTEFAAIPVPYYTGYFPLLEIANLREAEYILVTAASSSTGIAAMQFAQAEGVKVIATSRTSRKKEAIMNLGADYFVATEEQNIVETVRGIVGDRGVDIIYDPIGGKMIQKWYNLIKRGGYIVHYGVLDPDDAIVPQMLAVLNAVTLKTYMIFEFTGNQALGLPQNKAALDRANTYINQGMENGNLKPVIAKVFDLADVAESHRYMESNQQVGKIVVRTN